MKWPSCREATHLASQELDRELGLGERAFLRFHLAICNGCTNFQKQIAFLRKAVRRLGSGSES